MSTRHFKVLVFGAEPSNGPPTRFEEELGRMNALHGVSVTSVHHTTFSDLAERIEAVRPSIIQISAHGKEGGILVLENGQQQHEIIPPKAVELLCSREAVRRYVRGVLLNSCYSRPLADELVKHFDFAIGTTSKIANKAAAAFPPAFYAALARGEQLVDAVRSGSAEAMAKHAGDPPVLSCAEGIEPSGYRLRTGRNDKPVVYIHHDPADEKMLVELRKQLFSSESRMEIWDCSRISGDKTHAKFVTQQLERADMILLLASPAALASARWVRIKDRACVRHQSQTARLYLMLLRPFMFLPQQFGGLEPFSKSQVAQLRPAQRDRQWVALVEHLEREATEIQSVAETVVV